jgi:hypothetical protein
MTGVVVNKPKLCIYPFGSEQNLLVEWKGPMDVMSGTLNPYMLHLL